MLINDIIFAGFAGRDAEDRVTGGGTRIVTLSLCHTEKKENREEVSTWVRVKVFGAWCDTAANVAKGDNVLVKGKLNVSQYTDSSGKERTSVDIITHALGVIAREQRQTQGQGQGSGGSNRRDNAPRGGGSHPSPPPMDDIPF